MIKKIIISNGDSWTHGSEVVSPALLAKYPEKEFLEIDKLDENNSYRTANNWSTRLAEELNARSINISRVADDNNTILNRTINFVLQGIQTNMFTSNNILLIIGWTTPERRDFWYRDPINASTTFPYKLSPHGVQFSTDSDLYKFWKIYTMNFWNPEEYLIRHLMNMMTFENFCKSHNINFLHFNAFYQTHRTGISLWKDLDLYAELKKIDESMVGYNLFYDSDLPGVKQSRMNNFSNIWEQIDSVRYYKKDKSVNSFKSFIENSKISAPFTGIHPSKEGHYVWAMELSRYINEHRILSDEAFL